MKTTMQLVILGTILLAESTGVLAAEDLNGTEGKVLNMDLAGKSFDFLTKTVYDPETGEGKSRYKIYWTDDTIFRVVVAEKKNFADIKGPVIAEIEARDDEQARKLAAGSSFVPRVVIVLSGEKKATGITDNKRKIVSWFTPDDGASRKGTVQVNGKPVEVLLGHPRHSKIYVHRGSSPKEMSNGFWKTKLMGKEVDGRFVASYMELMVLPDHSAIDDPNLPRVLVVGDSISNNYDNAARAALKGKANYHLCDFNCWSTFHGLDFMEYWMGDYTRKGLQWDVIQFNHGLHDLKQPSPEAPYAVPLEKYKENLKKEIEIMKKSGATLIWCSTTPVYRSSNGRYGRQQGAEKAFNAAAMEVISQYPEIQVNDLCKVVNESAVFDNWRKGRGDVHFYKDEEQAVLGKAVADAVMQALAARKAAAEDKKVTFHPSATDCTGKAGSLPVVR